MRYHLNRIIREHGGTKISMYYLYRRAKVVIQNIVVIAYSKWRPTDAVEDQWRGVPLPSVSNCCSLVFNWHPMLGKDC